MFSVRLFLLHNKHIELFRGGGVGGGALADAERPRASDVHHLAGIAKRQVAAAVLDDEPERVVGW